MSTLLGKRKKLKKSEIFKNVPIHIVLKGLQGHKIRHEILKKNALSCGATIFDKIPADKKCLVLTDLEFQKVVQLEGIERKHIDSGRLKIVRADWITQCIMQKDLIDVSIFQVSTPLVNDTLRAPPEMSSPTSSSVRESPSSSSAFRSPNRNTFIGQGDYEAAKFARSLKFNNDIGPTTTTTTTTTTSESMTTTSPQRLTRADIYDSTRHASPLKPDDPLYQLLSETSDPVLHRSVDSEDDDNRTDAYEIILRELETLALHSQASSGRADRFRAKNYRTAMEAIKTKGPPIYSLENLRGLSGLQEGGRIWFKIGEIIATGALKKAQLLRDDSTFQLRQSLSKIWGAGPAEIDRWIKAGVRSVGQLQDEDWRQENGVSLTQNISIGLKYYKELQQRIERELVEQCSALIKSNVEKVMPGAKMLLCGSYRRGKPNCGDIDIVITHTDKIMLRGGMDRLVERLFQKKFVIASLTTTFSSNGKWMGVCKYENRIIRVDLKIAPPEELACAVLHATGSAEFNRAMSIRARKLGYKLGMHDLRRVYGKGADEAIGEEVVMPNEKKIFEFLGVCYYEPSDRNWQGMRKLRLLSETETESNLDSIEREASPMKRTIGDNVTREKKRVRQSTLLELNDDDFAAPLSPPEEDFARAQTP